MAVFRNNSIMKTDMRRKISMSKQFDKQFKENAVRYYHEHKDLGWNKCAENLSVSRNAIHT